MTPEQQIIALAELDRWTIEPTVANGGWKLYCGETTISFWWNAQKRPSLQDVQHQLPNYLGDLNAIRALVLKLGVTIEWRMCFVNELHRVASVHGDFGWRMATAGPEKWCEAVLRTAGKWVEE